MKVPGLLSLFFVAFAGLSCGKSGGSGTEPDVAGTVTITAPVNGPIYTNGSPLTIEGEMTDNNVLAIAKVEIRNKTSGAVLFQASSNTGNVSFYRFLWTWNITGITTATVVTVKVTARDKLGNEVFKEVDAKLDI
jgi:Bacterial Ig domain